MYGPAELSVAQSHIWSLNRSYPAPIRCLIPLAIRLKGALDLDALNAALLALEERHEPLRTTFEQRDGLALQIVQTFAPKELRLVEVPGANQIALMESLRLEHTTPFNLEVEAGWRTTVFQLSREEHVLSIVMHQIISDDWSLHVLQRELAGFYSNALRGEHPLSSVKPLPIQYHDFAQWQKQEDQRAEQTRQLEYWVQQLNGSQPAVLLYDKDRPAASSGRAKTQAFTINGTLYGELQQFCRSHMATLSDVLLAAFRAAHFRLTGVDDATIGIPIANRNRQELEGLIGLFANLQCIRIPTADDSFETLVQRVQSICAAASAHRAVHFEELVAKLKPGARDLSRNPLVQILFAVHSEKGIDSLQLENLETEPVAEAATTKLDLEFHLFEAGEQMHGNVTFATDLCDISTIRSLISVFLEILRRGVQQPDCQIATIPLTDELPILVDTGAIQVQPIEYPRNSSIPDLFRRQVEIQGNAIAVKDASGKQMSYAELDRQSDHLASWLAQLNRPIESVIGVLAPRSCETIVAFLGVLKSNLAYLPPDINVPCSRLEAVLSSLPDCKVVLLGQEVEAPVLSLDVDFVRIGHIQGQPPSLQQAAIFSKPSATSLAYIMFTSGSTGRPKGVMVEHRSVVRLVRNTNVASPKEVSGPVAHLSNLSFDGTTWEIYAPLLNGGTIVCIDYLTVLNVATLGHVFQKEGVWAAMLTPAILKECLANAPWAISGLRLLFAAGDRLDTRDAHQARQLITGDLVNGYGPTENVTFSTVYRVTKSEQGVNGIPIGKAISNSSALVMDPCQQPVGPGVIGELVVTGDGLSRGYVDPALNQDRFVEVSINGDAVKAYRTGDRVRYRPSDGQIEFFGRMDNQIKIRGFRIEPAEVEHALLKDPLVGDAVALVQRAEGREPELVSFITLQADNVSTHLKQEETDKGKSERDDQVGAWADLFESRTYATIEAIDAPLLGQDFMGWTSMYDGKAIDRAEMTEWLEDTMAAITRAGKPANVLEIGTGTGMILFNLEGSSLQSYVGLEPSASAAAFVTKMAQMNPALAGKVQVHTGTAADVTQLGPLNSPDLVVINSVAQYFPTAAYLSNVIETLVALGSVERIFFGDVRSYALYREFAATKALRALGDSATRKRIQQQIVNTEEVEEELLVEPAFFTALKSKLPALVEHVEILPKKMNASNELSCYRYGAVIHLKRRNGRPRNIHSLGINDWIDFQDQGLHYNALLELLRESSAPNFVAIRGIPFSKIDLERRLLDTWNEAEDEDAVWVASLQESAHRQPALSPCDLVTIAEQTSFRVELSWARQRSLRGGMDAVFHRLDEEHPLFHFPTEHERRREDQLTNRPLRRQMNQGIETHLQSSLRAILPAYMVPTRVNILDAMPVNANGKVDRHALASLASQALASESNERVLVPPQNETQRILCEEFAHVLGMKVGIADNFFDLGGHSLMVTKLATRLSRRLDRPVSVRDIFVSPVIRDLAAQTDSLPAPSVSGDNDGHSRHHTNGQNGIASKDNGIEQPLSDLRAFTLEITSLPQTKIVRSDGRPTRVLLTGATGYFGTALVHRLLCCEHIHQVYCLVRADSVESASRRLIRSATIAGWWDSKHSSRITYWLGDLKEDHLGLSDRQWCQLSGTADAEDCIDGIIHNGAKVNAYSSYEAIRAANVVATVQLLRAASHSPFLTSFVFVSTTPWLDFDTTKKAETMLERTISSSTGYVCSKLVAEQITRRSSALEAFSDRRLTALKAGYIVGNADSGIANVDDFLWRIVAGSVLTGCYPEESEESYMYISSSDYLARLTTEFWNDSQKPETIKPHGMWTRRFWTAVKAGLPAKLEPKPVMEWETRLREKIEELGPDHPLSMLPTLIEDGHQVLGHVEIKEHKIDENGSESLVELESAVTSNVKYLLRIGYFSDDWDWKQMDMVFTRGSQTSSKAMIKSLEVPALQPTNEAGS